MSAHPILSLKAAIRTHLLADGALAAALGGAVYDAPPRGSNPPFLVLGDANARENATSDADGRIIDLELAIYTKERGSRTALLLAAKVEILLEGANLTLDAHRLIALSYRETQTRHDPKTEITRASMKLRAYTEPL